MSLITVGDTRRVYRTIRDRAVAEHPERQAYIQALWVLWNDAIDSIEWPDDTPLPADTQDLAAHYGALAVVSGGDSVLDWLDAYPDAIYGDMVEGRR